MKRHHVWLLITAVCCLSTSVFASVQFDPQTAGVKRQGMEQATFNKKEFRDFARAKKVEQKVQTRAERAWRSAPVKTQLADSSIEQIFAAILCFFLGGLGIHRLYLQADPIIILWYFITFGGFFLLIPVIDFIRILMGQTDHYRGNSNLFRAFQ
jgi:hypothetical protein